MLDGPGRRAGALGRDWRPDMAGGFAGLLIFVLIPVGFVVAMVLALVWQRRGLTTQERAMSDVQESLALSRRSVELQEQMAAMAEESVRNQREMLELLRRLTERRLLDSRSITQPP